MRPAVLIFSLWQVTQYWLRTACSCAPAMTGSARTAKAKTALFILGHQFLNERHGARLFFRHVGGEVDAFRPSQGIAPLLVLHVEPRALLDEQFNDVRSE